MKTDYILSFRDKKINYILDSPIKDEKERDELVKSKIAYRYDLMEDEIVIEECFKVKDEELFEEVIKGSFELNSLKKSAKNCLTFLDLAIENQFISDYEFYMNQLVTISRKLLVKFKELKE